MIQSSLSSRKKSWSWNQKPTRKRNWLGLDTSIPLSSYSHGWTIRGTRKTVQIGYPSAKRFQLRMTTGVQLTESSKLRLWFMFIVQWRFLIRGPWRWRGFSGGVDLNHSLWDHINRRSNISFSA